MVPMFSEWASPVVLVTKRDGSIRFRIDYGKLNSITIPDYYPLQQPDDYLEALGGYDTFSTLDKCFAYWQIEINKESIV